MVVSRRRCLSETARNPTQFCSDQIELYKWRTTNVFHSVSRNKETGCINRLTLKDEWWWMMVSRQPRYSHPILHGFVVFLTKYCSPSIFSATQLVPRLVHGSFTLCPVFVAAVSFILVFRSSAVILLCEFFFVPLVRAFSVIQFAARRRPRLKVIYTRLSSVLNVYNRG